ncbi:hypothetical protein Cni_G05015 [Canna indica]|uniref:RING-type E3 ubiquitin transferase n=1 Tax=Canna indica TaxID=4628 RepID=A0AAQ3Q3A8_9LILI|nr:hypothetical protein Cni_G05015 [Canna indica]
MKLPSPVPLPLAFLAEPPPPPPAPDDTFGSRITPSVLLIIVILAVIFFISGLLHLLVRYLFKSSYREPADPIVSNVTVFQGQLQQLFHLHDAGVDQSFIDTLPIFHYKSIIGVKDPFDCAVCLSEFEADDKLRLLPICSHAFHLECIDTWLLSHSTCPLCRRCLLADFSPASSCSPLVLVLESGSESSREIASVRGESTRTLNPGLRGDDDLMANDAMENRDEIAAKEEAPEAAETKVVSVKLGKFRSVDAGGNGELLDQRRCLSMGSYEYVMDDSALLRVAIRPTKKKPAALKKASRRVAMSECDCHSRREGFGGFDASFRVDNSASASLRKKESFSVSKIWLQTSRKDEPIAEEASSRAFSFRWPPLRRAGREEPEQKKNGSEVEVDVEAAGSCNDSVVSRLDETPSFPRRTLLWILGRQNRIEDHA